MVQKYPETPQNAFGNLLNRDEIGNIYISRPNVDILVKDFVVSNLPDSHIERFIRPFEIGRMVAFVSSP